MVDIEFRGKSKRVAKQEFGPLTAALVFGGFLFLSTIFLAAPALVNTKPMEDFEYESGGYWCHEKTVCCDPSNRETCTSFESCRRPGARRAL